MTSFEKEFRDLLDRYNMKVVEREDNRAINYRYTIENPNYGSWDIQEFIEDKELSGSQGR